MRISTLAIAAFAQLASLASAAPLPIQPETSPNEDAVLLPRQAMCTNYPGTIAGHHVNKRSLEEDLSSHTDLLPRSNHITWCHSHSSLYLSFATGTRHLLGGAPNTATLFTAILHNISVKVSQGQGGAHIGTEWLWLVTVGGEGIYVQGRGMTWNVAETAVRALQNYVAVRKDYRAVPNVGVVVGGAVVGKVALGGPQP